ncbi:MAG: DNA polymerase Y family protein [Betaproteobacteria bacterium]|nr:MAG: DNA polymerase Y family protein [Betaproteobacteria bacterium]
MLWVALHFPHLPPGALETIAAWACQFTPRVSLEPPQALLLEAQGSLRYFGGEEAFFARLAQGLTELGLEPRSASAATPRAALWLARSEKQDLEQVPLEAICDGEPLVFLRSIGLGNLGDLVRLPREGLARRCGQALLDDLDRALGAAPEPRAYFSPPPSFAAKLELPAAVAHAEALALAARRLLARLEGLLAARQAGVRAFTLTLIHEDGESRIEVGLASAARDKERLARLLHEKLALLQLARPVEAIRLEACDFTPLAERSAGMFGDASAEAEDWARLVERLRARLGHAAVSGLATQPDHRPEHAWRRVEPGEWDPREFRQPGPRPSWLLQPKPVPENSFRLLAGPERIESGWWDGDEASRDYFVARLADESLAWIYREAGEWYLHGLFA